MTKKTRKHLVRVARRLGTKIDELLAKGAVTEGDDTVYVTFPVYGLQGFAVVVVANDAGAVVRVETKEGSRILIELT